MFRGVGSSLKLGSRRVGCYGERGSASPKLGSGGRAPSGSPGAEPLGMSGGRSSPEAGGILVLEHTFFALSWSL